MLPYPDRYDLRTMAMAMSVNGKYQNNLIAGADWAVLAADLSVDRDQMAGWVRAMRQMRRMPFRTRSTRIRRY